MAKATVTTSRRRRAAKVQATLADVARAATVSTATASRALSNPEQVSSLLRDRVTGAAGRLGYAPHYAARALASRRSQLIGAIIGAIDDPLLGPTLAGCQRRLASDGQALVLTTTCGETARADACARTLIGLGVDALLLFGVSSSAELARWRSKHGRPGVFVDASGVHNALSLTSTKQRGMVLAARYLRQLGHRRLLLLSDDVPGVAESVRAGLGGTEVQVSGGDCAEQLGDDEVARALLRDALSLPSAPTAVICSSDTLAALAVRECCNLRARIPDTISIIGFGDTALARVLWPALTTVRIPLEEVGRGIAEALLAELDSRPRPRIELPVRLVLRDSSGPPPS